VELYEGAILAVGGIALVYYMANKNTAVQATLASGAGAGLSNASNLTTITNTAGGVPTVMGEPLEPPQPPLTPISIVPTVPPNAPAAGFGGKPPGYITGVGASATGGRPPGYLPGIGVTPVNVNSGGGFAPRGTPARPIDQHVIGL